MYLFLGLCSSLIAFADFRCRQTAYENLLVEIVHTQNHIKPLYKHETAALKPETEDINTFRRISTHQLKKLLIGKRIVRQDMNISGYNGVSIRRDGSFSTGEIFIQTGKYTIKNDMICFGYSDIERCIFIYKDNKGSFYEAFTDDRNERFLVLIEEI